MRTLKKGNKGNDVKLLQKALSIDEDGIFGVKTEDAVKAFQKRSKLIVDGIVGTKTWNALLNKESLCIDKDIIYLPLSVHITKYPNRPIRYLAIHFTAGSNSSKGHARNVKLVFEERKASADFAVDDEEIVQLNPDLENYYCWAVGDKKSVGSNGGILYGIATNRNTISIEICSTCKPATSKTVSYSNHEGWSFTKEALHNAIKLAKLLMERYNIPINRVVRHYDISGKLCPGIIGWNNDNIYTMEGKRTLQMNNSNNWEEFKYELEK